MSNTVNRYFHLVNFQCFYASTIPHVSGTVVVPENNVAYILASALLIEGVSRNRNALIDGNTENYDWESGYTCHQIGSGCITIQLAQPYVIDSMRMLLWDCDNREYSYYIEVSLNQRQWYKVVDRTQQSCRSWQLMSFEPRPISYIKIVGTRNTANEVFHVVHFECPSSVPVERPTSPLSPVPKSPATEPSLEPSPSGASSSAGSSNDAAGQQQPIQQQGGNSRNVSRNNTSSPPPVDQLVIGID